MSELASLLEIGAPLAVGGAGVAYTRARMPRAYWATIGLPMTLGRIGHSYAEVMEACGLVVEPPMWKAMAARAAGVGKLRPIPPRITRIAPTATGLRLRLRLAKGQETASVRDVSERLRHAWGVHGIYVHDVRPGVVEIRLTGFDILRRVVLPARAVAKSTELLRIPVGLREDGTLFVRDFRATPHSLSLGATSSGKSMFQRGTFVGLARQPVALVSMDLKVVDTAALAPRLSAQASEVDAAVDLIEALNGMVADRFELIRQHQGLSGRTPAEEITADVWGLPEELRPTPVVVQIDEIAELFLTGSKQRQEHLAGEMIRFAQLARAAGMYLEVSGQRFGSELGKGATALRAQLSGRICHRVNDEATAKMALGDISETAVAAATRIAENRPGTAIAGATSGAWSRIRTPEITLAQAVTVAHETAHLTPYLPELVAFRPVIPAPAVSLDDVADAPPAAA
ncbi:FtsK/SpoIIIE domain-containing protein [Phaeacidiphilus oryzae]|uniref:FtsK/SpoIIIE domain-containing protein n=1 Tax=Phaeacidiphilus oryzae TaxID=348818 RepID=UPI00068DE71B|nr:FtsK/SpoIIIE domain-containing protein [Phaeacidiphilus oryzae]